MSTPLTLRVDAPFPPHGYLYREPAINWEAPRELAMQGLDFVASALSTARAQNPASGLDPSYAACVEAVKQFQCARFAGRPEALERFCGGPQPAPVARDASRAAQGGCRSCGGRR